MPKAKQRKTGPYSSEVNMAEADDLKRWARAFKASRLSPKMFAILGALLEEDWTNPRLVGMRITSDGWVMGQREGDVGLNEFVGTWDDFERNIRGVAEAVLGDDQEDAGKFVRWALFKARMGFETMPLALRGSFSMEEAEAMRSNGVIISEEQLH